jgi:hypothetical protein
VYTSSLTSLLTVRSYPESYGNSVRLYRGYTGGRQYGFALMDGSTELFEQVRMQITANGGATWTTCSSMPVSVAGQSVRTSLAFPTSSSTAYRFRACGDIYTGASFVNVCTGAW